MSLHSIEEKKKDFQIERIALFSDAVFAIAITLLVIEIKVPVIDPEASNREWWKAIYSMMPVFIGYVISFYVIAIYWITHHKLLYYVTSYNRKLLWRNIHFLFWIALMPFSSAIYSEYIYRQAALFWYCIHINILGIQLFFLWKYIGNPKHKLSFGLENKKYLEYNYVRALSAPFLFSAMMALSFISLTAAWFGPFAIPILFMLLKRRYRSVAPHWD